jgi:hypothetical protein
MIRTGLVGAVLALTTVTGAARAPPTDETGGPKLANELAGVKLGSGRRVLEARFPKLHPRLLATGELAYAACDAQQLVVFTFIAKPLSPDHVTDIQVRRVDDAEACRGASGPLPDLGLAAATPAGIAIGDPAARALARYGKPDEQTTTLPNGDQIVRYRSSGTGYEPRIRNILLVLVLRDRKVRSLTLTGDVPGLRTPSSR